MRIAFRLNGADVAVDIPTDTFLLECLRDLGIRGCRLACGLGVCGACTAIVEGRAVATCLMLAAQAEGREVTTIEGLGPDEPLVQAFIDHNATQCGYCIPGFVLTAATLLEDGDWSDDALGHGLAGNLCRCGTYSNILAAVRAVRDGRADAAGPTPPPE